MNETLNKDLSRFFNNTFGKTFNDMSAEDLKCLDWFVNEADQFIEEKQEKTA